MTNRKEEEEEEEEEKEEKAPPKVYMIIDNKKEYIGPEIVKKYKLWDHKVSPFSDRKLYVEKD